MNNLDKAGHVKSILENFRIDITNLDVEIDTECEECTNVVEEIYNKYVGLKEVEKFINKEVHGRLVDKMFEYIRLHRKDMVDVLGEYIAEARGEAKDVLEVLKKHNWIEKEKGELDDEKKKETKNSTANTPLKKGGTCMARNS